MKKNSNLAEKLEQAKTHLTFQHNPKNTDGFITIARKNTKTGNFTQTFYTPQELEKNLSTIIGEDVFFSQNTFYRKARRIETIRQLRSLYVDIDFYRKGLNPEQALYWLEEEHFNRTIPEPNLIIYSGRGIVLNWIIQPVPYKALPLWQAIQNYFVKQLEELGSDTKAVDAARIFRIAGTTSSKNGKEVCVEYRHEYTYSLREIQEEYLPEISRSHEKKKGQKTKIVRLFNIYTLHGARLKDLEKLVTMREGDMPGCREIALFLYRYWSCCFEKDETAALEHTMDFNNTFKYPLLEREVIRATKSAEKAYLSKNDKEATERARTMGYPGAGYRLKNSKIIEWLGITEEEQRSLNTIIGKKEKNRRKRAKYHENRETILKNLEESRRRNGKMTKEEYQDARKKEKARKKELVKEIRKENPQASNREIAKIIGCSEITIRRYNI